MFGWFPHKIANSVADVVRGTYAMSARKMSMIHKGSERTVEMKACEIGFGFKLSNTAYCQNFLIARAFGENSRAHVQRSRPFLQQFVTKVFEQRGKAANLQKHHRRGN